MATPGFLKALVRDAVTADERIREGRFQKALALMAGLSGLLAGVEVSYEHYQGSYGQKVMYTPVLISPVLLVAGVWGALSGWAARTVLPVVSGLTLLDSVVGFGFHIRGICRKPGGWRVPIANIVMGPPLFAPLLFGIGGYLGLIASFLRRSDAPTGPSVHPAVRPARAVMELATHPATSSDGDGSSSGGPSSGQGTHKSWEQDVREGRFQRHLAAAAALSSLFSGFESLYSHYKNNFRYRVQYSPLIVSGLLTSVATASVFSRRAAKYALPLASLLAVLDGGIGFIYHALGILRRPGGVKKLGYNILYGPPILAPLLFSAAGLLGLLGSLMRREK